MTQLCCLFSVRFLQPRSGEATCTGINAAPRGLTSEGNKSVIWVVTFCIMADRCSGVPRHVHHHLATMSKDKAWTLCCNQTVSFLVFLLPLFRSEYQSRLHVDMDKRAWTWTELKWSKSVTNLNFTFAHLKKNDNRTRNSVIFSLSGDRRFFFLSRQQKNHWTD